MRSSALKKFLFRYYQTVSPPFRREDGARQRADLEGGGPSTKPSNTGFVEEEVSAPKKKLIKIKNTENPQNRPTENKQPPKSQDKDIYVETNGKQPPTSSKPPLYIPPPPIVRLFILPQFHSSPPINEGRPFEPQAKASPPRTSSQPPARPLAEGKNPPPSIVSIKVYADKEASPFNKDLIRFIVPSKLPTVQQSQPQNAGSPLSKQIQSQTTSPHAESTAPQASAAAQQTTLAKAFPPEALLKLKNIAQNIQDLRNMSLPPQQLKELALQVKKMVLSLEGVNAFSEATGIPAEELAAFLQAAQGGQLPSHLKGVPFQIFAHLGAFLRPVPMGEVLEELDNLTEINKLATQYHAAKKAEEEKKKKDKGKNQGRKTKVSQSGSAQTDPNSQQNDTAANAKDVELLSEQAEDLESQKRIMGFM